MRGFDNLRKLDLGRQRRPPLHLAAGALILVALILAACGQAAPTVAPPTQPPAAASATVSPSEPIAAGPTDAPSTQEPAVAPSDVPTPAVLIPSVTVADQPIVDGKVIVARVVSAGPGWLVIHAQSDGQPGPVLGYSPVKEGDNLDLVVLIDATKASETLYAMLHSDAGQVGTYEFPGSDGPVLVDGQVVAPTFAVTGGLASAQTPEATPILPTAAPSATAVATPSGGGSLPTAVAGEAEVEMEDFQFVPKLLVVRAGTTVKFANKDRAVHTATSDTDVFDSGTLNKGEEFSFTFTQPGEYPYYCTLHGGPGGVGMAGKIVVVP